MIVITVKEAIFFICLILWLALFAVCKIIDWIDARRNRDGKEQQRKF